MEKIRTRVVPVTIVDKCDDKWGTAGSMKVGDYISHDKMMCKIKRIDKADGWEEVRNFVLTDRNGRKYFTSMFITKELLFKRPRKTT